MSDTSPTRTEMYILLRDAKASLEYTLSFVTKNKASQGYKDAAAVCVRLRRALFPEKERKL